MRYGLLVPPLKHGKCAGFDTSNEDIQGLTIAVLTGASIATDCLIGGILRCSNDCSQDCRKERKLFHLSSWEIGDLTIAAAPAPMFAALAAASIAALTAPSIAAYTERSTATCYVWLFIVIQTMDGWVRYDTKAVNVHTRLGDCNVGNRRVPC